MQLEHDMARCSTWTQKKEGKKNFYIQSVDEGCMLLAIEGSQTGAAYSDCGLTCVVYKSRGVSDPTLF